MGKRLKALFVLSTIMCLFLVSNAVSYAQAPVSQDFDNATGEASSVGGTLTLDKVVYSTDSPDDQLAVDVWTNGSTMGSGNVLLVKNLGTQTGTYFQFASEDSADNFKIGSLEMDVYDNTYGFADIYTVTGYDEGVSVASATVDFITTNGIPTLYGSGNSELSWTRQNSSDGSAAGILTFTGSAWGNVDQLRFTDADLKPHEYMYGILDHIVFEDPVTPKYTVTYSGNGNSTGVAPTDSSSPYEEDTQVSVLGNTGSLAKTGHTFAGWNTAANGSGTNYVPNGTFNMGTENTTLYAKWTPNKYEVSFDVAGGSVVSNVNADYNTTITAPTVPTRANYSFGGWYKESILMNVWNFATDKVLDDTTLYAKWNFNNYNVSFDVAGGSTIAAQQIDHGSMAVVPVNPTKTGYTFDNWYTDGSFSTLFDFATAPISGNTTIYAKWTPISYAVSFDVAGGSEVSNVNADYNTTITAPTIPTKANYSFGGWYKDSVLTNVWDFATDKVLVDTTLYAKWNLNNYTVSFDVAGGSTIAAQQIDHGSMALAPADPTKTGHTFDKWYTDGSFSTPFDFATAPISGNTTIYAKWTPINYAVSFDVAGGSEVSNVNADYNTTITAPTFPTRANYSFGGWYKDSVLTNVWDFATDKVLGDTTLYAKWNLNNYDVSFDVAGGSTIAAQQIDHGSMAVAPADPTKTGYTFDNWYTDSSISTLFDFATTPISGDTTIYAKWTPINYAVSFDVAGGSVVPSMNADYNTTITAPTVPTRANYSFGGWYKESVLTNVWDFATEKVLGNITLYAKWNLNNYNVNFNVAGGSAIAVQQIDHGSMAVAPADPTKTGYTFDNWYTDSSFSTLFDFATAPISGDTTIYAKWTAISYEVSFDVAGGSVVPSVNADYNTTITAPTIPTRANYSFGGWYKESVLTNVWDFATDKVLGDTTLYVKWISMNTPSTPTTTTPSTTTTVPNANGIVDNTDSVVTTKVSDQIVTTYVLNPKKLEDSLVAESQNGVIIIPVNTKSDVVVVQLNGEMVKKMADKHTTVKVQTEKGTYSVPAQQINIHAISEKFGKTVVLQDIKIEIEIATPLVETMKIAEDSAVRGRFTMVVPPLNFTVRATVGNTTIEVNKFEVYVERTIAIPDTVDPNRITTGVVIDPDGTVRHVPTKIIIIDGKYYAKVNSLTNSTYSIIWHAIDFQDVAKHWAKDAVNDMGSRMIVTGDGNEQFNPDQDITRAEFAAIIVRALGLKLENKGTSFSDVNTSDWYSSAIQTAYTYNLISGFADGSYHPMDKITREQAMTIIAKAMEITALKGKTPSIETGQSLSPFADANQVSTWARDSVADSLQAGIVSGRSGTQLAPKAHITRAEVAVIVQRLLQKSDLI